MLFHIVAVTQDGKKFDGPVTERIEDPVAEGRVVQYNFGRTFRSYPTAEEARAECERFKDAGHHATIARPK